MSSNDNFFDFLNPVPLVLPLTSEKNSRDLSNISKCCTRKAVKRPSSDSVLSMPFYTKLVWEIKYLKQKIDSTIGGQSSEREIYQAILRGKESLLKLEQERKR